tara:strand:+ start:130 stop:438 length:309 start_codon:yes stop_codon:yes gene_type:complete
MRYILIVTILLGTFSARAADMESVCGKVANYAEWSAIELRFLNHARELVDKTASLEMESERRSALSSIAGAKVLSDALGCSGLVFDGALACAFTGDIQACVR